jgi:hypothetical protein
MSMRTTRTTLSFRSPFTLPELDQTQPAGDYILDTDEEAIDSMSRIAWRRVATFLHLPSIAQTRGLVERVSVDPTGLDVALLRDCGLTYESSPTRDRPASPKIGGQQNDPSCIPSR